MTIRIAPRTTLGLVLLACASCAQSDFTGSQAQAVVANDAPLAPARAKARPTVPPTADPIAKPLVMPDTPPPATVELTAIGAHGSLMSRLPKSALLVVRFPHVEKLAQAVQRTPFSAFYSSAAFGGAARAQLEAGLAQMEGGLAKQFPDYDELKSKLGGLEGELVLALESIDAKAFTDAPMGPGECPVTAALMFDAGAHAADLDHVVQRGLDEIVKSSASEGSDAPRVELVSSAGDDWHRALALENVTIDFRREGTQFLVQVGPAVKTSSKSMPLALRDPADSFAAAHVVRATRDLTQAGAQPVGEMFVNLDPIWTITGMFAPPEVRSILDACGAPSIHGFSAVAGLGQTGIDEAFLMDSPGGNDLLTKVLAGRPLDAAMARFVPRDTASAWLGSFDLQALYEGVMKVLPDEEREALAQGLDALEGQGVDVRKDVIANVGPTIGLCGNFDFLHRMTAAQPGPAVDFTFFASVQDGKRLADLFQHAPNVSGPAARVHSREMDGFTILDAGEMTLPDGAGGTKVDPAFAFGDHAFLFSATDAGLVRALEAAKQADNRGPQSLQSALATNVAGAFSVGTIGMGDEGPTPAATIGRRTSLGLEITTHEGNGTASFLTMAGSFAVAASVAIPKLMAERAGVNEAAAVASLRSIAGAELAFRQARHDDLDRDGQGEFGTLGELSGASALRSSKPALQKPLLPSALRPTQGDCCVHDGYVFRVDVARRMTHDPNDDEREFIAYAWPVQAGMSGLRVFSIDADGRLLASDNHGDHQHYEGADHQPLLDASKRSLTTHSTIGIKGRTGRDGGTWINVE